MDEEPKKSSRKSKSESRKSSSKKSSKKKEEDYSDEGQWDPVQFDKQTSDCWKDIDKPKRAADLPSPDIADYERQEGDEDWPYKKSYAVDERKSKSKKETGLSAPKRTKSDDEGELPEKEKRSSSSKKKSKSKSKSSSRSSKDYDDEEGSDVEDDLHSEGEDEQRARRRPKKHSSSRNDDEDSEGSEGYDEYSGSEEFSDGGSYYSEEEDGAYSSELDGSIASDGTYDSAEEYEEYGGMPPETPAMMNYNQEINELMHKANPERTDHLMNRVNRQKGNVVYDQNMPMMTRQALMTRQASAQAARNRVDASSIDRSTLGFRNESFHGKNNGAQKPVRRAPGGKRAPPRSKSSGLGTMAMASRRAPTADEGEDKRGAFRGRGASTSMQRYSNKPNNVARMSSGRRPGEMDRSGHKPAPRGEPRRGNVGRAKSTTALSRGSAAPDPQKPIRRAPRRPTKEEQTKANEVTDESDSDVEYSSEESDSDGGPSSRPKRRVKKVVDKQDMTVKKHRQQLHGMMYQIKMSVEMSDLMKEVKKGEIPKSPIRSLLMDEP